MSDGQGQIRTGGVPIPTGKVSAAELAELIGAFSEVTTRLQGTHEQLHAEVARLTAELRQANEQLERSRRLAALGEMAAGIAHEVRNPLGSIRLYARMLKEDLQDRPAERHTVGKIDRAAQGLAGIVEDLLMFAREFKIRREPVPVAELIGSALEACREGEVPGFDSVGVERAPGIAAWGTAALDIDRGLVVRALVNVIRNAVEAMVESGITPRRLLLDAAREQSQGASCILRVCDTGPGVPPEVIPRMFNPFFTTRQTGTGLGLAIVHRIMEAHGGQVCVRTLEGRQEGGHGRGGACVELRLPLAVAGDPGAGQEGLKPRIETTGYHTGAPTARGMAEVRA